MIVVDAGVVVKLYRDEAGSDGALDFIEAHAGEIVAPDLLAIEVAGAIVRDVNIAKASVAGSHDKLANFFALLKSSTIRLKRADRDDIGRAASMAIELGHPIKDCTYLELAIRRGCDLVTCDARFAEKAQFLWPGVRPL